MTGAAVVEHDQTGPCGMCTDTAGLLAVQAAADGLSVDDLTHMEPVGWVRLALRARVPIGAVWGGAVRAAARERLNQAGDER